MNTAVASCASASRPRLRRRAVAFGFLLCAVTPLAGCGNDGAGGGTAPASTTVSDRPSSARSAESTEGSSESGARRPAGIRIPTLGVHGELLELGLDAEGTVQVPAPEQGDRAGWYTGGGLPGDKTPVVVIGHNKTRYGNAVFARLHQLEKGGRIQLELAGGKRVGYTVRAVETVGKDRFPTRRVYGTTDRPELHLVTCAGSLDSAGHPVDNLVVYATQD